MVVPLKLYFIPYLAAGHIIPLCDIAKLFASRGQHVTIITTPSNAQTLRQSNHLLRIHTVPFPSQEVGLPDGVENLSSVSDMDRSIKLWKAIALLRGPMEQFVEQHPPDCIIADVLFSWVPDFAQKLHIPCVSFNVYSLFTICTMLATYDNGNFFNLDPAAVQNLPRSISLGATPPEELIQSMKPLLESQLKSYAVIINSFAELDGQDYIHHYHNTTGRKAWHLGPVSLCLSQDQPNEERGMKSVVCTRECVTWLDSKAEHSVVYISFGSLCYFQDAQLYEIACGIEASGHDFIWVVPEKKGKEEEREEEKERWLPKGFEERNEKKGMIIRGWAPQMSILGHPSVGAFVTHCGWNSTVEAVSTGIPMLTWPVHGEQFYNEKLITEVREIGVELGATEWTPVGVGERCHLLTRDCIQKGIRGLMDGGDQLQQIRRRAKELGQKAHQAVREGGSSHANLTALIQDLIRLRDA